MVLDIDRSAGAHKDGGQIQLRGVGTVSKDWVEVGNVRAQGAARVRTTSLRSSHSKESAATRGWGRGNGARSTAKSSASTQCSTRAMTSHGSSSAHVMISERPPASRAFRCSPSPRYLGRRGSKPIRSLTCRALPGKRRAPTRGGGEACAGPPSEGAGKCRMDPCTGAASRGNGIGGPTPAGGSARPGPEATEGDANKSSCGGPRLCVRWRVRRAGPARSASGEAAGSLPARRIVRTRAHTAGEEARLRGGGAATRRRPRRGSNLGRPPN